MVLFKVLFLVLITEFGASVDQDKCLAILHPTFDNCGDSGHLPHSNTECLNSKVCGHPFYTIFVNVTPFDSLLKEVMKNVLSICCGGCARPPHYENHTSNITSISYSDIENSSFVFPIFGRASETNIYGYHYIPVMTMSSGYFITKQKTPGEIMMTLINSCANLWPLLIIMLLFACVAGFIVWVIETWTNKEEFPRSFLIGLFQGFWWAFVSMTTVGYGDKSPRFVLSRLFAVVWILIGITICSMFTASLTTEIDNVLHPSDPVMRGKIVGVLKYRAFDAAFVAHHGGLVKEAENILELKQMLFDKGKYKEIDGVFMDKYTYMHTVTFAKDTVEKYRHAEEEEPEPADEPNESRDHAGAAKIFLNNTLKAKEMHDGEKMSYGILVKDEVHFKFFYDIIAHNQIIFETCAMLQLNEEEQGEEGEHNLFSPEGGYFHPFLYATIGILAAIMIVGVIYEIYRLKGTFT